MNELYIWKLKPIFGYGEYAVGYIWEPDNQTDAITLAMCEVERGECDWYLDASVLTPAPVGLLFNLGHEE